jgi:hopanoid biosynthesis associated RND transporter like protein HpnN
MIESSDWIKNGLAWWVRCVLRFPKITIVVILLLAGVSVAYTRSHLGINTDTADMISPELPWRRDFIAYRESFAVRDRNIVIVVDAGSAAVAAAFAADLAATLRREPQRFHSVFLAGDGEFFERNGLLYLSIAQLEDLGDRLAAAQPLLGLLSDQFNGAGVVSVVQTTVDAPASGRDDAQLDAVYAELEHTLRAASAGQRHAFGWQELITGTPRGPARELVLVQPALDFDLVQPARGAIERIREIAAQLQSAQNLDVRVRLTGTIAMEHEELASMSSGMVWTGLSSLALVALVLLWALRSPVEIVISLVTLLVGLTYTAAFAAFAVGHLNLLSVAFAVLYFGLGVDFVLHMFLRFRELRAFGRDVSAALVESAHGVGASLLICAVTTAVGFYAFIPTQFEGVSELGLITGTGMLISLAVSITLMPAFAAVIPTRIPTRLAVSPQGRAWLRRLRHPRAVVPAAVVIAIISLTALPQVSFDGNPIRLRDPDSESVQALADLAADGEAPIFDLVALAGDPATARTWARELEGLSEVRRVVTVDSLIPAQQSAKLLLLEDIDLVMGPNFADLSPAAFDAAALRAALTALRTELTARDSGAPPQPALLEAVSELIDRLAALDEESARERLRALDADLTAGLARALRRLATGLRAGQVARADLPPELAGRYVNERGQELVEISPAENVNDKEAAERFVASVRSVAATATGLPVVYQEAAATVVRSFQLAFLYALIMIVALLFLFLRRAGDVMLVLAPILFASAVTAAITVWLDIPFNFANIITLPLLVGIGVDNGIHLVHRMRTEPPASGDPLATSTSRAVVACALTTIASFGTLAFSPHVGVASMGRLLTLGMTVTLLATLFLLPALLRPRGGS